MGKNIAMPFIIYLSSFSVLLGQQSALKHKKKNPAAFVQIAYQDIKGASPNRSLTKSLEKSIVTFGDRKLIEEMVVRFFLRPNNRKESLRLDSVYYIKAENAPHLSRFIYKNPYLIACYSMISFINRSNKTLHEGSREYGFWQKRYLPNIPVGVNDNTDGMPMEQALPILIAKTQHWVLNYSEEYQLALSIFNDDYQANIKKEPLAPDTFFIRALESQNYYSEEELDQLMNYDILKKQEVVPVTLPDDKFMFEHTNEFIEQAYESLYLRSPSREEMLYLNSFITQTPDLTPVIFYYAMMTSDEYKWY